MPKRHILVADDELNMLRSLEFILEAGGYKVTGVKNGQDALDKILLASNSESPIELIITDIQMPGLNGTELIDELYRLEINIPVFVITAYGSSDLVKSLKGKEEIEYIDKPIDDEELLSMVKKLFESSTGSNQIFTQAH
jgi:DNA-binding NtrC family response regulator